MVSKACFNSYYNLLGECRVVGKTLNASSSCSTDSTLSDCVLVQAKQLPDHIPPFGGLVVQWICPSSKMRVTRCLGVLFGYNLKPGAGFGLYSSSAIHFCSNCIATLRLRTTRRAKRPPRSPGKEEQSSLRFLTSEGLRPKASRNGVSSLCHRVKKVS